MAGCILLGGHAVTIEYGTDPGETNMLIKSGDAEVNFYVGDDGSLNVTFSGANTVGANLLRVIQPPREKDEGYRCLLCGRLTKEPHDHEVK